MEFAELHGQDHNNPPNPKAEASGARPEGLVLFHPLGPVCMLWGMLEQLKSQKKQ